MRAPIIRAKKQKILDILSNRNSAPKGKTNKNANVIFTDMTHCIILQTIGCKGVYEELLQMADFFCGAGKEELDGGYV